MQKMYRVGDPVLSWSAIGTVKEDRSIAGVEMYVYIVIHLRRKQAG